VAADLGRRQARLQRKAMNKHNMQLDVCLYSQGGALLMTKIWIDTSHSSLLPDLPARNAEHQ